MRPHSRSQPTSQGAQSAAACGSQSGTWLLHPAADRRGLCNEDQRGSSPTTWWGRQQRDGLVQQLPLVLLLPPAGTRGIEAAWSAAGRVHQSGHLPRVDSLHDRITCMFDAHSLVSWVVGVLVGCWVGYESKDYFVMPYKSVIDAMSITDVLH